MAKIEQIAAHSDLPIRLIELLHNSGGPARLDQRRRCRRLDRMGRRARSGRPLHGKRPDAAFRSIGAESATRVCCNAVRSLSARAGPAAGSVLGEILGSGKAHDGWFEIPPESCLRQILIHGQFLVGYPGFMFRRRLWAAKGGVCESLKIASDVEFLCWICSRCPIGLIAEMGYVRREHDANVCRQRLNMEREDIQVRTRYALASRTLRHDSRVRDAIGASRPT